MVGTYHMPCAFRYPQVMMIHCALSAQHIQRLAADLPYVFVGDFNIKPDSSMYDLLTSGEVKEGCVDNPVMREGDKWTFGVKAMKSAYFSFFHKEPAFTNYAQTKDDEAFLGTLDYIFISPEWKVVDAQKLPEKTEELEGGGPLPTKSEPSDHLLLAASLEC